MRVTQPARPWRYGRPISIRFSDRLAAEVQAAAAAQEERLSEFIRAAVRERLDRLDDAAIRKEVTP